MILFSIVQLLMLTDLHLDLMQMERSMLTVW
jgi:hypothetical protein